MLLLLTVFGALATCQSISVDTASYELAHRRSLLQPRPQCNSDGKTFKTLKKCGRKCGRDEANCKSVQVPTDEQNCTPVVCKPANGSYGKCISSPSVTDDCCKGRVNRSCENRALRRLLGKKNGRKNRRRNRRRNGGKKDRSNDDSSILNREVGGGGGGGGGGSNGGGGGGGSNGSGGGGGGGGSNGGGGGGGGGGSNGGGGGGGGGSNGGGGGGGGGGRNGGGGGGGGGGGNDNGDGGGSDNGGGTDNSGGSDNGGGDDEDSCTCEPAKCDDICEVVTEEQFECECPDVPQNGTD